MALTKSYAPYRDGLNDTTGSTGVCPFCGVKPRNQHSLRQSAECDWQRRTPAERKRLGDLGAQRRKAVA